MRHPDERQVALYAAGDVGWIERLSISRHCNHCPGCGRRAEAYRRDREAIRREAAELPPGLNWNRLASEMTANIRVGLAAGECVGAARVHSHLTPWRPILAVAAVLTLLVSGWYLKFPAEQRGSLASGIRRMWTRPNPEVDRGVALESTRSGIQVSENGSALTMMHPGAEMPVVMVSTRGSMRARYIDTDTGQVTITNVYAK
jgi:hypothetical protein